MVTETTMLEMIGYDHEVARLSGSISRLCKRTKPAELKSIADAVGELMRQNGYGTTEVVKQPKEKVKK